MTRLTKRHAHGGHHHTHSHAAAPFREMNLTGYQIVLRRVLYDRDIWLKTPEQIARWLRHCRANARTRFMCIEDEDET